MESTGWFGIKGTSKISLPPRATGGDRAVPCVSEVSPCPTGAVPAPAGAGIAPILPGRALGRAGGVRGGVVGRLLGCSNLTIAPCPQVNSTKVCADPLGDLSQLQDCRVFIQIINKT